MSSENNRLTMTIQNDSRNLATYPKKHLIAASGVAAMVSMVLLVYPSKEVEAKKAILELPAVVQARPQIVEPLSTPAIAAADPELAIDDSSPADGNLLAETEVSAPIEAATEEDTEQPIATTTTEPEPAVALQEEQDLSRSVSVIVENGSSLSGIFGQLDIGHSLLMSILEQDKNSRKFTQLKAGQELVFSFDKTGQLASISSQLSPLESMEITRDAESGQYKFGKTVHETAQVEATARGTIESSLLAATQAAGMPYKLALDMANVFAYDVDFARDVRAGDSFEIVYEQKLLDDQVVGTGNILAARYTNKGKTHTAVRYTDKNGQTSYYNSDGTSSRRAFIRTPVDFSRISSRFNPGRKHPILNKIRAHKGVDYAAPTGTPIKATGNGKISFVGNKSGYGKTIIIQHGGKYRTLYAHMNGYAKGIRNGSTVSQGQIIGYVGMTGLATGPHLHYEFHVNGTHVNPLSHKLPTADPIPKAEMARFKQATQTYIAMLDEAPSTQLAKADLDAE